jgi:hypothetical protein
MSTGVYAEQRHQALKLANAVRIDRARLKRRIKAGEITAAQVILDPPSAALGWAVVDVLVAQRQWGAVKARRLLRSVEIGEHRAVGSLTNRQRTDLAGRLRQR